MSRLEKISYYASVLGVEIEPGVDRVTLTLRDLDASNAVDPTTWRSKLNFDLDNLKEYGPNGADRTDAGDFEVFALLSPGRRVRITIEEI